MNSCDIEPFSVIQTPQISSMEEAAMAVQALQIELESWLSRFKDAVCSDLEALSDRIDELHGTSP